MTHRKAARCVDKRIEKYNLPLACSSKLLRGMEMGMMTLSEQELRVVQNALYVAAMDFDRCAIETPELSGQFAGQAQEARDLHDKITDMIG